MMNSVVEKLAAIEKEVATIQPKITPLTGRIADLTQKVSDLAQQLNGIVAESAAIKQDVELTQQGLFRIQSLIGESKAESEQLFAGQEENLQRCETMQAVFGTAFQAVSQFFEAAQRMGLADQAKAVFLTPPPAGEAAVPIEMVTTAAVAEESAPPMAKLPPVAELPAQEPQMNDESPMADALPDESPALAPPAVESGLAESDFDSPSSDVEEQEFASLPVPGLPDVAAPPDNVDSADLDSADLDSDSDSDSAAEMEPAGDIASELDVPPLNLSIPPLPEQGEGETEDDTDEIEALLASMGAPVTAAAGSH